MSNSISSDASGERALVARPLPSGSAGRREKEAIRRGTVAYRQASFALFLAGFSTFSLLYCVQPLLPEFARSFGVDPASSSLALSLTTGALAFAIFVMGALSQALPRRRLMFASMTLAALCNLLAAFAPHWPLLLAARLLEGLVLGGVPAVAMAYLAEEIDGRDLGKAMGLYVAGTAFGGMAGRIGMGLLTEIGSWRMSMATLGFIDLVAAVGFAFLLPPSRNFVVRHGFNTLRHVHTWGLLLRDAALRKLFAVGFILMSVFVTLFNYTGFRLSEAPYHLGQAAISNMFLVYVFGIVVSPWAGTVADRYGRRLPMTAGLASMGLGAVLTLGSSLWLILLGIFFITIGFFGAHAVASGWVGRLAGRAKGHAASLYLLFYYLGSSIVGSAGGWFWQHEGWAGVVTLTASLAGIGVLLGLSMKNENGA